MSKDGGMSSEGNEQCHMIEKTWMENYLDIIVRRWHLNWDLKYKKGPVTEDHGVSIPGRE